MSFWATTKEGMGEGDIFLSCEERGSGNGLPRTYCVQRVLSSGWCYTTPLGCVLDLLVLSMISGPRFCRSRSCSSAIYFQAGTTVLFVACVCPLLTSVVLRLIPLHTFAVEGDAHEANSLAIPFVQEAISLPIWVN